MIGKEQQEILNSLRCERLSDDEANLRLVEDFYSRRNASLAHTLQNEAYEEDIEGGTAYFVVKDGEGNIVFFFSLKSGLLYDQHIDERNLKFMKKVNLFVEQALTDPDITETQIAALAVFLEKLRSHKGVTKADFDSLPKKDSNLLKDLEIELNNNITHVGKTYSAIELVHFCANDAYRDSWPLDMMEHSLGEVVYWLFVVPKIIEARRLMGIQYFYLFAADMSSDKDLVKYYNIRLKFTLDVERSTVKPLYDLSCKFMYQETKCLEKRRKMFFENFSATE